MRSPTNIYIIAQKTVFLYMYVGLSKT